MIYVNIGGVFSLRVYSVESSEPVKPLLSELIPSTFPSLRKRV